MDEATPHRVQGDLPMTPTTTPEQLTALAQAMTEVTEEIHAPTDELDGLSSRLGLIAGTLTGTAAAARRMAQLSKDDERSQMSTRERLLDSAGDTLKDCPTCGGGGHDPEAIPPPLPCSDCDGTGKVRGVALQDVEDPGDDRCLQNAGSCCPTRPLGCARRASCGSRARRRTRPTRITSRGATAPRVTVARGRAQRVARRRAPHRPSMVRRRHERPHP